MQLEILAVGGLAPNQHLKILAEFKFGSWPSQGLCANNALCMCTRPAMQCAKVHVDGVY